MSKVTRPVIEAELLNIFNEVGHLTPDLVVDRARDETNPLHRYFDWDDTLAAERWRADQALKLIRDVKIKFTVHHGVGDDRVVEVRRWLAPPTSGEASDPSVGYISNDGANPSPEVRELLLRRMRREMDSMRRRYAHLEEFWKAVDALLREHQEDSEETQASSG